MRRLIAALVLIVTLFCTATPADAFWRHYGWGHRWGGWGHRGWGYRGWGGYYGLGGYRRVGWATRTASAVMATDTRTVPVIFRLLSLVRLLQQRRLRPRNKCRLWLSELWPLRQHLPARDEHYCDGATGLLDGVPAGPLLPLPQSTCRPSQRRQSKNSWA